MYNSKCSLRPNTIKLNDNEILQTSTIFGAWDIESAVENPSTGKQIPYCLVLKLFKSDLFSASAGLAIAEEFDELVNKSCLLTKTFVGERCVDEFIEYITHRWFDNTSLDILKRKTQNILPLYSFNGAKYDHALIIKKLMVYQPEIVGGNLNTPRSISIKQNTGGNVNNKKAAPLCGREIVFMDFWCILPIGSLKESAKSIFPKESKLIKGDFDVKSKPWSYFEQNKVKVIKYCDLDVLVLGGLILRTINNLNILIIDLLRNNKETLLFDEEKHNQRLKINIANVILPHQFNFFKLISASQWTFEMFKNYFMRYKSIETEDRYETFKLVGEKTDSINKFVRSTYHGGMTCCFIEEFSTAYKPNSDFYGPSENELYMYDINSSYPWSMSGEIPYYNFKSPQNFNGNYDNLKDHHIYYVSKMTFKKELGDMVVNPQEIYPTPKKGLGKYSKHWGTIYPKTIQGEWIWGYELNKIAEVYKSLSGELFSLKDCFEELIITSEMAEDKPENESRAVEKEKKLIFKDYIEFFYEKKSSCAGNADLAPLKGLYKLFLNSLYGKFGQQEFPDSAYCYGGYDVKAMSINENNINVKKCGNQPGVTLPIYKVECNKEYKSISSLVRIASFITMKSRMKLWEQIISITAHEKNLKQRVFVYYCDTDSIFSNGPLYDREIHGTKLGLWKREDHKDDVKRQMPWLTQEQLDKYEVDKAIFLAPKCYALLDTKHFDIITGFLKTKGVKYQSLGIPGFLELAANREINIKQEQFRRQIGQVYVDPDFKKKISLRVKKRIPNILGPFYPLMSFISIEQFEQKLVDLFENV